MKVICIRPRELPNNLSLTKNKIYQASYQGIHPKDNCDYFTIKYDGWYVANVSLKFFNNFFVVLDKDELEYVDKLFDKMLHNEQG